MLKQLEVEIGAGSASAGCRSCGKVFTSVTAFDMHQRVNRDGIVCLDPAAVGLERKPSGKWSGKATEAQRARIAHFNDADRISDVNSTALVSSGGQAC